jgi:hypothetical protein
MSGTSLSEVTETPQRPPSLDRAYWAAWAWVALSFLSTLDLWVHRDYVRTSLRTANDKAKNKQDYSTAAKLDHAVTTSLIVGLLQAVVVGVLIAMTALQLRRGKPWARWVLIALAIIPLFGTGVLVQLVGGLSVHAPADYKLVSILAGLAALAVLVLLLMPDTSRYFANRRATAPAATRPIGLGGGLFGQARRRVDAARATRASDAEPLDDPAAAEPGSTDAANVDAMTDGPADEGADEPPASARPTRPRSGAKPKTPTGTRAKYRKR